MIELKRVIAPVDDTPFDEICSFETDDFIGVFIEYKGTEKFALMPKDVYEFCIDFIDMPKSLEELDCKVYDLICEHINCVSTSRHIEFNIIEDY